MLILGIAGGVASGKSSVAKKLEALSAYRLDVDQLGHEVLKQPDVVQALVERWGSDVLNESDNSQLSRQAIAAIVFAESAESALELEFLESITHPRIQELIRGKIEDAQAHNYGAVVLDAALLFKAGWDRMCDYIIFVDVDLETRLERALQRGWSPENFFQREKSQVSLAQKKLRSDFIVENSGTLKNLGADVQNLWNSLGLSK